MSARAQVVGEVLRMLTEPEWAQAMRLSRLRRDEGQGRQQDRSVVALAVPRQSFRSSEAPFPARLTEAQERQLFDEGSDDARKQLVETNMRLAVRLGRRYARYAAKGGLGARVQLRSGNRVYVNEACIHASEAEARRAALRWLAGREVTLQGQIERVRKAMRDLRRKVDRDRVADLFTPETP